MMDVYPFRCRDCDLELLLTLEQAKIPITCDHCKLISLRTTDLLYRTKPISEYVITSTYDDYVYLFNDPLNTLETIICLTNNIYDKRTKLAIDQFIKKLSNTDDVQNIKYRKVLSTINFIANHEKKKIKIQYDKESDNYQLSSSRRLPPIGLHERRAWIKFDNIESATKTAEPIETFQIKDDVHTQITSQDIDNSKPPVQPNIDTEITINPVSSIHVKQDQIQNTDPISEPINVVEGTKPNKFHYCSICMRIIPLGSKMCMICERYYTASLRQNKKSNTNTVAKVQNATHNMYVETRAQKARRLFGLKFKQTISDKNDTV